MAPHIGTTVQTGLTAGVATDSRRDHRTEAQTDRDELAAATHELLLEACTADDPRASELRDQAVVNYLWLADRIARRYQGRGEDDEDLVQVARSGLVEAAKRYDPRCTSFPAFAVPTITGVVKRHFRDHGWLVRPPRTTQETATQLARIGPEMAQQLGGDPDDQAVAGRLGKPVAVVREARLASRGYAPTSLDSAMAAGVSFVAEDAGAERERAEVHLIISRAWRQLDDPERRLLMMRFVEERSQADIAAEIGTSQMQVSRMLNRTLRRMRTMIAGSEEAALA
jgi:RNA polymerase sigma-B factor